MIYANAINYFNYLGTQYAVQNCVTKPWSEQSYEPACFSQKDATASCSLFRCLFIGRLQSLENFRCNVLY